MVKLLGVMVVGFLVVAVPVFAQPKDGGKKPEEKQAEVTSKTPASVSFSGSGLAAGLGMGLTIIGGGLGLGRIGAAALESMARQPEVAARVQTAMIVIAAMLEGATLASVIFCFIVGLGSGF
jgi:F-type H+-transporting ATPase subunit c